MPITSKEALRILQNNGWEIHTTNGSHFKLQKQGSSVKVILPMHNKDLKPGIIHQIEKLTNLKLTKR